MKILLLAADFYPDITESLINGAKKAFAEADTKADTKASVKPSFTLIRVKGALELPVALSIHHKGHSGAVALGCIIRGKTTHFDLVATHSLRGLMDVAVRHKLPIGFGIIAAENRTQALERAQNPPARNAGWDAALGCLSLINATKS